MTQTDAANQPNFKNAAYSRMSHAWDLIETLVGGTAAMRAAGKKLLPQEPAERAPAYDRRLARSVFFNAYRRTREGLVGMVFKENPEIAEDVPGEIQAHLENIDLAGTHIDVFAKECFTDQFDGHVAILVDMPPALGQGSTLADERAANRRPYWVRYKGCQVLNWRTAKVNGEEHLTQITFEEKTCEPQGNYGEQEVTRYRVFRINETGHVEWELYRKQKAEGTETEVIVSEATGRTSLSRIPVAFAYGRRKGIAESEPPLLDLAHLNVAHWQEYSDYRNILHVANVPILALIGGDKDADIEIGGNSCLILPENGDAKYVEHQGSAIGAARQELVDLEQRMAVLGLSILSQKSDTQITATEKNLDHAESSSELATMARSFQDCLEQCLMFHADYIGQQSGGSITLAVDDDELTLDPALLTVLLNAVDNGKISLETWLTMLKSGNILPEDLDIAEEMSRIGGVDTTIGVTQ